jgi:hypothetical protein
VRQLQLTVFIGNGYAEYELWTVKHLNVISELVIMELLSVLITSLISITHFCDGHFPQPLHYVTVQKN